MFKKALFQFVWMAAIVGALSLGTVYANPPNPGHPDNGEQAPPCHGHNNNDCRPDPQPDHGQDCHHSDDHVCEPTPGPTEVPHATPTPQPNTPNPQPTATSQPPTSTPIPNTPVATPTQQVPQECIPCGEAEPMPPLEPTSPQSPASTDTQIATSPATLTITAPAPLPQVLPATLPKAGGSLPIGAGLVGGLGLLIMGWKIWRP